MPGGFSAKFDRDDALLMPHQPAEEVANDFQYVFAPQQFLTSRHFVSGAESRLAFNPRATQGAAKIAGCHTNLRIIADTLHLAGIRL